MEDQVLFFERQFMPTWALVVVAVTGLGIPALIFMTKGVPTVMLFLMMVLLFVFMLFVSMQTRVTRDRLIVTFGLLPLIRFSYKLHEITSLQVRVYQPASEYGGWGIKGSRHNKALSMQGTEGVQLDMIDREGTQWKLLVGSQMPTRLEEVLLEAKAQYIFQPVDLE